MVTREPQGMQALVYAEWLEKWHKFEGAHTLLVAALLDIDQ